MAEKEGSEGRGWEDRGWEGRDRGKEDRGREGGDGRRGNPLYGRNPRVSSSGDEAKGKKKRSAAGRGLDAVGGPIGR